MQMPTGYTGTLINGAGRETKDAIRKWLLDQECLDPEGITSWLTNPGVPGSYLLVTDKDTTARVRQAVSESKIKDLPFLHSVVLPPTDEDDYPTTIPGPGARKHVGIAGSDLPVGMSSVQLSKSGW
jgi:hypothetical protein